MHGYDAAVFWLRSTGMHHKAPWYPYQIFLDVSDQLSIISSHPILIVTGIICTIFQHLSCVITEGHG
jgi:hypothetical protein